MKIKPIDQATYIEGAVHVNALIVFEADERDGYVLEKISDPNVDWVEFTPKSIHSIERNKIEKLKNSLYTVMSYKISGLVKVIGPTEQISETIKKRSLVITTTNDNNYTETILFEVHQDRCSQLDKLQPGQTVDIDFSISGREWVNHQGDTKYFNTFKAWRITPQSQYGGDDQVGRSEPTHAVIPVQTQYQQPVQDGSNVSF